VHPSVRAATKRTGGPASEQSVPRARLALGGIVLLGLGFRLWGITWGLQNADVSRRPHPDEWTIYWLFRWFDRTHNLNPCPHYPKQCFFDWGAGYPYLAYVLHFPLAPFFALLPAGAFGPHADPQFVHSILTGRIVSALASTATIYVAYRLATLAFGRPAGLFAALLVAISGLLIQLAHFATPDSTMLLALSLALLAIYRMALEPSTRRVLIAGAAIGIAAGTEYHTALLVAPFLVAWRLSRPRTRRQVIYAAGAAAAAFLALNIYLVIDFQGFLAAVEHTLRIRTVDSSLEYGDRWAPYGPAWLYVVRYPLGFGLGFVLAGWMLVGLAWAMIRRTRADLVLLAWIVPYFLLVTLEPAKFMRYSAPLLVPLALLGGRFAWELLRAWPGLGKSAVVAATAAAVAFTASYDAAYAGLFTTPESRATAVAWVNAHARPGQTVAFEEIPDGLLTMPYFLRGDLLACFLQERPGRLSSADYVLLDSYAREELSESANSRNQQLAARLLGSPKFREVEVLDDQPTFLGMRFPIGGSPHDWRYPAHRITIYRRIAGDATSSAYCFTSLQRAAKALYIPPAQRR
jgi:hypothetical protein